ncbi:MAG TPA: alpha/beta fold hydrolase [Thermoanaerobaculia bacterium]|jgi:hypothetical protein|nr:alpha/beta fold hydrolase [Thermoanaerobaculia bacterium]
MRHLAAAVTLISILPVAPFCPLASAAEGGDRVAAAEALVDRLAQGDFAGVVAGFDATMTKGLPEAKLRAVWTGLLGQTGAFLSRLGSRSEKSGAYDVVVVSCRFERATLDAKVAFSADGKVAALFFAPSAATAPAEWQAPPYVRPGDLVERQVTVSRGEWALPGTLSLPAGKGPFPALVLVQGSGPQDRDETIGANKPFRDLALGLASRGIAVLRYDKRTLAHGDRLQGAALASLTVNEETVDDALAAARLLRSTPEVDPRRVFVLGHSLGGMLLPRIGQRDRELAGLVVLAGTTRPLTAVIREQLAYLESLGGAGDPQQLAAMRADLAKVEALDPAKPPTGEPVLLMGAPPAYWLDLQGYQPAAVAAHLPQRMLVLQGERDYQVTMEDLAGWQRALAGRADVTFRTYRDLNHLFMTGNGKATPAEYQRAGHVAAEVVDDIAGFVRR